MGSLRALGLVVACGVAASLLVGCSTTDAGDDSPASHGASDPAPRGSATPLPPLDLDAVGVEIRQDRASWGLRVVQVHVTYDGPGELPVLGASLSTEIVTGTAASDPAKPRTVPSGSYRDLDLPLGEPVCGPRDGALTDVATPPPPATITLTIQGRDGDVTIHRTPTDPNGHLARIHAEDCAAAAFASAAGVRLGSFRTEQRGDQLVGLVYLAVEPVPGGPPASIDQVDQTILFQPVGSATAWTPVGTTPIAGPVSATLVFRPGRCDPHAVADDKRGTFFGLRTTVDGVPQHVFYVQLPDEIRGDAKAYIGQACGW